jgi:hypothetical protein
VHAAKIQARKQKEGTRHKAQGTRHKREGTRGKMEIRGIAMNRWEKNAIIFFYFFGAKNMQRTQKSLCPY